MPPTSWVELALAGLAEARGHDGHGHREHCAFSFFRFFRENANIKKLYAFERVESQFRHLEPVGWKSTLAHLSVHFHISMHILKMEIHLDNFEREENRAEPCGILKSTSFWVRGRATRSMNWLGG